MSQFSLGEWAPTIPQACICCCSHCPWGLGLLAPTIWMMVVAATSPLLGSCFLYPCCLMAVLAPEVNHSSTLPSMGHSHCLFFPVPGMPQTRLWKELESLSPGPSHCCVLSSLGPWFKAKWHFFLWHEDCCTVPPNYAPQHRCSTGGA